MKKLVSIIIVTALIFMCAGISASAEGTEVSVPKIEIITENGNGASLQKADGYVNAEITITDGVNTPLSGSVLFKVRGQHIQKGVYVQIRQKNRCSRNGQRQKVGFARELL